MRYELKDVLPTAQDIEIGGKTYSLNIYTLDDAAYFDNIYGTTKFYLLMKNAPVMIFSEIAYRLIDNAQASWATLADFRKSMTPQDAAKNRLIEKTMATVGQALAAIPEDGDDAEQGGEAVKPVSFQKINILRKVIIFIKSLLRVK